MSALRRAQLIALPLALAACEGEKPASQTGSAAGEILPGSTSDAMIPYDTVRSQAPLAPMPSASARAGAPAAEGSEEGGEADAEAAEAAPAPTAAAPTRSEATEQGAIGRAPSRPGP